MNYHPQQGNPYSQQPPGHYQYSSEARRRDEGARNVAAVVRVVTGVVISIFALHVLFVVFGANQKNDFVSLIYTLAKTLVLGLGDVFTPKDAVLGVVLNYGLAALLYAIVGQLIIKALRRN